MFFKSTENYVNATCNTEIMKLFRVTHTETYVDRNDHQFNVYRKKNFAKVMQSDVEKQIV